MDENQYVTDELQKLQSSITSLVKSLIIEKNKCNYEKEKILASMESLLTEITNLKRENEQLRKSKTAFKISCETCNKLKKKLIIQDKKSKRLEKNLNMIREFLKNVPYNSITPASFSKLLIMQLDDVKNEDSQGIGSTDLQNTSGYITGQDENSQSEGELLVYDTSFIDGTQSNKNSHGNFLKNNKAQFSRCDENQAENSCEDNTKISGCSLKSGKTSEVLNSIFQTPKKVKKLESDFMGSPIFKELGTKRDEKSPILLKEWSTGSRQPFATSPVQLKRKASENARGISGAEKKLFFKSPIKNMSSAKSSRSKSTSQLKGTNLIEAEISVLGVRKLKQTQLNLDYYKSKDQEENNENEGNIRQQDNNRELTCVNDSRLEDDLILESPRNFEKVSEGGKKNENAGNQSKSDVIHGIDPDETFVSSMIIKNIKQETNDPFLDKETSTKTQEGSKSPEYNSVPNLYKGNPVRKKSERMKLPGQMCMECNKYYKAILGEIDPKKMQEILNQCSRHRDNHYNVPDTPPGYWKPYLTATMDSMTSRQDDETFLDE